MCFNIQVWTWVSDIFEKEYLNSTSVSLYYDCGNCNYPGTASCMQLAFLHLCIWYCQKMVKKCQPTIWFQEITSDTDVSGNFLHFMSGRNGESWGQKKTWWMVMVMVDPHSDNSSSSSVHWRSWRKNNHRWWFFDKCGFCFCIIQGDFFHWYPPKKLKYGKPRLDESTLT